MTEVSKPIFANHFWGLKDDGYYALTAKMNNNKKTYDEIKSFYNIRASLHEEFGRKLMKHARNCIGREEIGTLHTLLKSAHEEMERNAQTHIDLSHKLKSVLEVYLDNFILEQKDKKKLTQTSVEKAHRYKQSSESYLSKVKEKYESDCAKLITLQTQIGNVSGREIKIIKQKIEKTQQDIKIQEKEYKTSCKKLAEATNSWNATWKKACDTYQIMEKQKLEFLHHSFSMYINILSTATHENQESYERFWKSLDNYNPSKDIEDFISEKGTGSKIPEAEAFIDYMDDPSKASAQYTIANFPTPPDLSAPDTPVNNKEFTRPDKESDQFTVDDTIINFSIDGPQRGESMSLRPLPSILIKEKPHTDSDTAKSIPPTTKTSQEKYLVELSEQESYPPQRHQTSQQRRGSIFSQKPSPQKQISTQQHQYSLHKCNSFQEPVQKYQQPSQRQKIAEQQQYSLQKHDSFHQPLRYQHLTEEPIPYVQHQDPAQLENNQNSYYQQNQPTQYQLSNEQQERLSIDQQQNALQHQRLFIEHLPPLHSPVATSSIQKNRKQQKYEIKAPQQETIPIATPTASIPDMDISSATDTSDEEHEFKGDVEIDPRANVVLAIGNNLFNLGHLNLHDYDDTKKNRRRRSADLEAACNFSYQGLLEEIGVYNKEDSQHQSMTVMEGDERPPDVTSPKQPILFWALSLTDWFSGKPEDLQLLKGTWLAVIEVKPDGWYCAIKFDTTMNQLTNEIGLVASSIVKVYS